jgi:hypothetical protein
VGWVEPGTAITGPSTLDGDGCLVQQVFDRLSLTLVINEIVKMAAKILWRPWRNSLLDKLIALGHLEHFGKTGSDSGRRMEELEEMRR